MSSPKRKPKQKRRRSDFADVVSTSGSSGYNYDVFLSFRGPDTHRTFADYLYESFVNAGFTVFRDEEELRAGANIGPEIERAIDDSRFHLPIFSAGYASSAWCLQELARMVKCQRESAGREIVPIFYDVSPSDVTLRTESYREALLKHEGRYGEGTVREWMKALVEVGNLSGLDARDKPLGKLVNDLVREFSIKLKNRQKVIRDNLVEIDDQVDDLMRLLDCGSQDVRYLGVYGMAGIGKTTLAKIVFNKLSRQFDGCSFLSNVQERSQTDNGIIRLQNQLLSDILKKPIGVHDVDEGIKMIKENFCRKKVLIILDDVDAVVQLTSLAANGTWFKIGSRIFVTTRNADLVADLMPAVEWEQLPRDMFADLMVPAAEKEQQPRDMVILPVYYAYEMTEMNSCHALELFSWHAFGKKRPPNEYDILSSEIVATLGGLPSALEAAGSYLRLKSLGIWLETLERLRKVPDGRVQEMWRTSQEKQIFLDITCFLEGVERTSAACVWKECGFSPCGFSPEGEGGLATLTNMSLLKIY